jgi:hypothetical protein
VRASLRTIKLAAEKPELADAEFSALVRRSAGLLAVDMQVEPEKLPHDEAGLPAKATTNTQNACF